jgi:hypothetical protein
LLLAGTAGAFAAAVTLWWIRPGQQTDAPRIAMPSMPVTATPAAPALRPPATLQASPGTRFTRESPPPHERVRLHEGRLLAEVTPARAGESFRIVTARGEVEVRGTVFETVATTAGLQAVRVERGRVAVRPGDGTEILLEVGQHWQRRRVVAARLPPATPTAIAKAPDERARGDRDPHWRRAGDVPRPATGDGPPISWPALDGRKPAAAGPADTAEAAFGNGLELLRAGRNAAAADAFDRAAAFEPAGPLAEDAWYWRAVALAREGASAGRGALAQFLQHYPLSARRGEAAVMLGWLLLDRGDRAGAERQFRVGIGDRSARVRGSAQAGLARLGGTSPR